MADATIHVRGLREMQRAFKQMGGELPKELKVASLAVGEIVAADARSRFSPVDAKTAGGFRPVVRARGINVEQKKRRTTGQHPGFGSLQMTEALLPALEANQNKVLDAYDKVLEHLERSTGWT